MDRAVSEGINIMESTKSIHANARTQNQIAWRQPNMLIEPPYKYIWCLQFILWTGIIWYSLANLWAGDLEGRIIVKIKPHKTESNRTTEGIEVKRSGCEYIFCRVTYRVFWLQYLLSEIC